MINLAKLLWVAIEIPTPFIPISLRPTNFCRLWLIIFTLSSYKIYILFFRNELIQCSGMNIVVELDYCNIEMVAAIEMSYKYMTENGLAAGNK